MRKHGRLASNRAALVERAVFDSMMRVFVKGKFGEDLLQKRAEMIGLIANRIWNLRK